MKKVLSIALGVIMFAPFVSETSVSAAQIPSEISVISTRTITVFMIKQQKGMSIKTQKKAIYDTDNNTICVNGETYGVRYNSQYGQSGSTGAFEYVAGGIYYFNL